MDDHTRLRLIVEAVRYCQRVRDIGMPASCYSKALREPIFFLWETRQGTKEQSARFRSEAAKELHFGSRRLLYDHAVPFRLLQDKLLALESPDESSVRLNNSPRLFSSRPKRTPRLPREGLRDKMPPDWDGKDPLARYRALSIRLLDNTPPGGERDA
jgi:hypothetical protein